MNAIILCGGLSTRLGEITKKIPKILLEIKGKTILEWQLQKLKNLGINEVVLAAGHLSDVLKDKAGEEVAGIKLKYAIEPERLGTGGAIKYAWQFVSTPNDPTIILNGNILSTLDMSKMIAALNHDSDGLILAGKVEDTSSLGTLYYDETRKLKEFREKEGLQKPGYVNVGVYIFTPTAKNYFPAQNVFSIEYDVFPKMTNLYVFESDHPWIDIGVPARLDWAKENWQE